MRAITIITKQWTGDWRPRASVRWSRVMSVSDMQAAVPAHTISRGLAALGSTKSVHQGRKILCPPMYNSAALLTSYCYSLGPALPWWVDQGAQGSSPQGPWLNGLLTDNLKTQHAPLPGAPAKQGSVAVHRYRRRYVAALRAPPSREACWPVHVHGEQFRLPQRRCTLLKFTGASPGRCSRSTALYRAITSKRARRHALFPPCFPPTCRHLPYCANVPCAGTEDDKVLCMPGSLLLLPRPTIQRTNGASWQLARGTAPQTDRALVRQGTGWASDT